MPIRRVKQEPVAATKYAEDDVFEPEVEGEMAEESQSLQEDLWGAVEEYMKSSGGAYFKPSEEPALVAFVRPGPVGGYKQHWVGKTSVRCLEDDCPVCDAGEVAKARVVFAIVVFEFKGDEIEPKTQLWDTSPTVSRQLRSIDADARKGGPIYQHYFTVYQTGTAPQITTTITPVKVRDLEDEPWGIPADVAAEVLAEAETDVPKMFKPDRDDLRKELEKAASSIRKAS